jgi:hypothetical protein
MTHEEKAEAVNILIVNFMRLDEEGQKWFMDYFGFVKVKKDESGKVIELR